MLQAIRSKAASWVAKVLFFFLILSFASYWIVDYIRPQGVPQAVATVGDSEISRTEASQAMTRELRRMRELFGLQLTPEQAREAGMQRNVVNELATARMIDLEAARLGVVSPEAALRELIVRADQFKGSDGVFSPQRYRAFLQQQGLTEQRLLAQLEGDWRRTQLMRAVQAGRLPDVAIDRIARHRFERRTADLVRVDAAAQPAPPAPSDAELQAFVERQRAAFETPERRGFSLLRYGVDDLSGSVAVSEEEVRAAYDRRLDELSVKATREVEQILAPSREAAEAAKAAWDAGQGMAEAAAAVPGAAAAALGIVGRGDLPPEVADAVFAIAPGAIGAPVQSSFGWHVFRIGAATAASTPSLDSVRARLQADIARERAADLLYERVNRLEDAAAGGADLAEIAAEAGVAVREIPPIDGRARDAAGAQPAGLPPAQLLLPTLFELAPGGTSRLIEIRGEAAYFMVKVGEIQPPALPPLAEIRASALAAFESDARRAAARQAAEALVQRVEAGTKLAEAAASLGIAVTRSAPFLRTSGEDGPPPALAAALFAKPIGGAAAAAGPEGHVVGELAEILPLAESELEAKRAELRREIQPTLNDDLLDQYETALRARFPVRIDERALEGL